MKGRQLVLTAFAAAGIGGTAHAQALSVRSNSSTTIISSSNTSSASEDRIAVQGYSTPAQNWGVGAHFEGGYIGLRAYSILGGGSGSRYGVYGQALGGAYNYAVYGFASTSPNSWAGYFSGNVYVSGTLTQASDAKLKLNIQDLPGGALAQILKLRPKTYRYRTSLYPGLNLPEGEQIGLIAQDVQDVIPSAVKETSGPIDPDDKSKGQERFLGVDYIKIVPLLIKAIQEQQSQIDALKAQVAASR